MLQSKLKIKKMFQLKTT